jgi:uncharacterized protein YciI
MPLFAVHALNRKGGLADRRKFSDEHRAHVGTAGSKRICMIMSGPILAADGDISAGSFYFMEAPDRETVVFKQGRTVQQQWHPGKGRDQRLPAPRVLEACEIWAAERARSHAQCSPSRRCMIASEIGGI